MAALDCGELDEGAVAHLQGRQVADAMFTRPYTFSTDADVATVVDWFDLDDHVHSALIVDGDALVAVVDRDDVEGRAHDEPAWTVGATAARLVAPEADLVETWRAMRRSGRRRLAVVRGRQLLGLLCLKRSGTGFCSAGDIRSRVEAGDSVHHAMPTYRPAPAQRGC